jgi:hypothetical protein
MEQRMEFVATGADAEAEVIKLEDAFSPCLPLADDLRSLVDVYWEAGELYADICKQVDWLFRAAMHAVIEKRVNFEFLDLINKSQLFDVEIVAQYGITAQKIAVHDCELEVKGLLCGTAENPNPYQDIMGEFSAEFIHDDGYDLYRHWTKGDLEILLDGVLLDDLRASPDCAEALREIKAWLDSFVVMVRLSRD